ncbi:MAG: FAD-binding oxidoreductase, partial [Chloroflexaceae bacterium]|nr:FAD-binding oxidoreductase [Chloroflexaceae bacterium]
MFDKMRQDGRLITDALQLLTYARDAGLDSGQPDAVALPHSVEEVLALVRWAEQRNLPLIARGAGTGLAGGAVAARGGWIVNFSRMNCIL